MDGRLSRSAGRGHDGAREQESRELSAYARPRRRPSGRPVRAGAIRGCGSASSSWPSRWWPAPGCWRRPTTRSPCGRRPATWARATRSPPTTWSSGACGSARPPTSTATSAPTPRCPTGLQLMRGVGAGELLPARRRRPGRRRRAAPAAGRRRRRAASRRRSAAGSVVDVYVLPSGGGRVRRPLRRAGAHGRHGDRRPRRSTRASARPASGSSCSGVADERRRRASSRRSARATRPTVTVVRRG